MSILWAIEVTPLTRRGKPWLHPGTIGPRRKDAWAKLAEGGTPLWVKTIAKRRRAGLLRAVKVTIEPVKEKP